MNPLDPSRIPCMALLPILLALTPAPGVGLKPATPLPQDAPGAVNPAEIRITAEPAELRMRVGESAALRFTALGPDGAPVDVPLRVVGPRDAVRIRGEEVEALRVGTHQVVATAVTAPGSGDPPARLAVTVEVELPPLASLEVAPAVEKTLYAGTTLRLGARARHADGSPRPDPQVVWRSLTPQVAEVDRFGYVTALGAGTVRISGELDGITHVWSAEVPRFPAVALEIRGGEDQVRTGDVQALQAVARDEAGREVGDLPVSWSLSYREPADIRAPAAPGQVREGRVVADVPGTFTVVASAGPLQARHTFQAEPRAVVQELEVLGQGRQDYLRTTDFWVFEGVDGRDYVLTGAKMSDGQAFVFDVTDPERIVKTDSIRVDARSINDVKVAPDGRYATVTREGASDRRNGLVLLDLSDPAHPVVASEFTEGLTGGVHNAFPTDTHVFALSGGEKYVILDVEDIRNPRIVSEVQHGDCRIHDVWVQDGIAYSAQWECGVIAYDVGNGGWGGSLENPVFINAFVVPGGATHAVFPYRQESTGRFYLFIGDEIMSRRGLAWEGVPGNYQVPHDPTTGEGGTILSTAGYIQVIDFTDPEHPEMVARYEVPEYGTHNIWVEDDVLYQAYYEGGLRVVDVSGELMGNLYTQGREMAVYRSADPLGYVPNSPMVWSAMPYKGMIFFTDTNSGVWAVRLHPGPRPVM